MSTSTLRKGGQKTSVLILREEWAIREILRGRAIAPAGLRPGALIIDDGVKLSYYRLTKTHEGSASLSSGETAAVTGPTDVGTGRLREEDNAHLSEIVIVLNERFGTDFTKEDQLFFDQKVGDLQKDDELGDQARNNSLPQFKLAFDPKGLAAVLARLERNEHISNQFMSNEQLRALAMELMMQQVYQHFQDDQPPAV